MRLQGTDGIRGVVKLTKELKSTGKSPVELFQESGILTDEFFELYSFGFAKYLLDSGVLKPGGEIAIGWDPRDGKGNFTSGAVAGIRKSGLNALVLGVVPTPMIPIFMRSKNLPAGLALTASHNPYDQNGIKIFLTPEGLKPLQEEEESISNVIFGVEPEKLKALEETGKRIDAGEEARRVFTSFHADAANSWNSQGDSFSSIRLVVDASNGACSGFAAQIFREAGFKEVMELNTSPDKGVNENCGVVGFENVSLITHDSLAKAPAGLSKNPFVKAMFELGKKHGQRAIAGEEFIMGVVFDGDGDRFYLAIYDPEGDKIIVLCGDDISIHQARYLMKSDPEKWEGAIFVNTVESDLQTSIEASKLGFAVEKTGVGDKWLLRKAGENADNFAIGSERSGHFITPGRLVNSENKKVTVFAGNGIKGALNGVVAIHSLYIKSGAANWTRAAAHPFQAGYNKITYVYYTDKKRWIRDSGIWKEIKGRLEKLIKEEFGEDNTTREKIFKEEPDLLYLEICGNGGYLRASIHIRNSGTEDKTGITVKGVQADKELLQRIAKVVFKLLVMGIKNPGHPFCQAQNKMIRQLYPDKTLGKEVLIKEAQLDGSPDRLLKEIGEKEGMVEHTESGYRLTDIGKWYCQEMERACHE